MTTHRVPPVGSSLITSKRLYVVQALLAGCLFIAGCHVELQPQSATATARVIGTDGVGTPAAPLTLSLSHTPQQGSLRVVENAGALQNVTAIEVSVERTGIPFAETFYFSSISRPTLYPETGSTDVSLIGGNDAQYVLRHVGDLAESYVESALIDDALFHRFEDFPPATPGGEINPVRPHGASYFARIEEDNRSLPFDDGALMIDFRRLATSVSGGITAGLAAAAAADDARFRLGGADNSGSIRVYFVPHVTHSTLTLPERNVKGVGLIYAATLDILSPIPGVLLGAADVYIPISILFEPQPENDPGLFRLFLDPFSMAPTGAHTPDNLDRILVVGHGPLAAQIASQVHPDLVEALSNLPEQEIAAMETNLSLLGDVLSLEFDDLPKPVPADYDVFLAPSNALDGVVRNRILPAAGGVPVKLFVLY